MDRETWLDLLNLAFRCAHRNWSRLLSFEARYEAALDGIVDGLLAGSGEPVADAWAGMSRARVRYVSTHGLGTSGRLGAEHYERYWEGRARCYEAGFEDRVLERITVWQVWEALPARHRDTLAALARADGDIAAAALDQDVSYTAYSTRLQAARNAARGLWYDPDPDPGHYAKKGNRGPGFTAERGLSVSVSYHRARRRARASI